MKAKTILIAHEDRAEFIKRTLARLDVPEWFIGPADSLPSKSESPLVATVHGVQVRTFGLVPRGEVWIVDAASGKGYIFSLVDL